MEYLLWLASLIVEIAGDNPDSAFWFALRHSWNKFVDWRLVFMMLCGLSLLLEKRLHSEYLYLQFFSKVFTCGSFLGIFHFIQFPQRFQWRENRWGRNLEYMRDFLFLVLPLGATINMNWARVLYQSVWHSFSCASFGNGAFHSLSNLMIVLTFYFWRPLFAAGFVPCEQDWLCWCSCWNHRSYLRLENLPWLIGSLTGILDMFRTVNQPWQVT